MAHFAPEGLVLAWPSAETGTLPVESGVAVAFDRQIRNSSDPEATRSELEAKFAAQLSPFSSAADFGFHDMVRPSETRQELVSWLDSFEHQWPLLLHRDEQGLFGFRG